MSSGPNDLTGPPKEQWGTRLGVILAVAGSAVGLGNFLRFPGQVAQNGGGAFMIPYFISLIILGLPMVWAEWSMGRFGGRNGYHSCPAIMGVLGQHKAWRYIGVLGLVIPIVIYMYYVLIEAWCLGYAWYYLTGAIDLGADPGRYADRSGEFFTWFTGKDADGAAFKWYANEAAAPSGEAELPYGLGAFTFWVLTFVLNFVLIYRGVTKGIEWFCVRAMPLMALCALIVLIRVLTLPANEDNPDLNIITGLGFMWNPDFGALLSAKTWLAAAGQIFFSISVGFGIIINYASYVREDDDIALSGLTAASTNEFFEVCLGGLITIPAAFLFLGLAGVEDQGTFGLGFNILPAVFAHMPDVAGVPMVNVFGFLWFFMLFLAAITSSLSMLQPAIAFLEEGLGVGRRASVALLGLITAMGSFYVIYFSQGLAALDTMDFWVGTALIFVLATFEVILFAWVFGIDRGYEEANRGALLRIPRVWKFVLKYISPVFLLGIFALWVWQETAGYVQQLRGGGVPLYTIGLISVLVIFLLILIGIAGQRWSAPQLETVEEGG